MTNDGINGMFLMDLIRGFAPVGGLLHKSDRYNEVKEIVKAKWWIS